MATAKKKRKAAAQEARTKQQLEQQAFAMAENDVDGCDCEFLEGDATADEELPEAQGGVELIPDGRRSSKTRGRKR